MANLDTFLPNVITQDSKKRLQVHPELVIHIRNEDSSLYCEEMDIFMDGITNWVNCSNFKVSLFFLCIHTIKRCK